MKKENLLKVQIVSMLGYCLYDTSVGAYLPPFFLEDETHLAPVITRSQAYVDIVKSKDYNKYQVVKLGTFDLIEGQFSQDIPKVLYPLSKIIADERQDYKKHLKNLLKEVEDES